jgi:hypothetical protein
MLILLIRIYIYIIPRYADAGLGFAELVSEYTGLLDELRDREWALRELAAGGGSPGARPPLA